MTYSILARDPSSGAMGVATQSQAFAVGSSVPWARPGCGVIATQSMGEPMYGELGLDALGAGLTASEAMAALRSVDPHPERRQVAMLDLRGGLDVYTGDACVAEAGHAVGAGCAALANMMASDDVWHRMVDAYASSSAPLPMRLLAALHAAEDAGGDLRGARSAAILVVRAERSGRPWQDQLVDLRVDDDPDPVGTLERAVAYNERYHAMVHAFELALSGEGGAAREALPSPPATATEPELAIWQAIVLAAAGDHDGARALLGEVGAVAPAFIETVRRFDAAALIDPELLDAILPDDGVS